MNLFRNFIRPKVGKENFPKLHELLVDSGVSLLDVGGRGGLVPALSGFSEFVDLWVVEPEPREATRLIEESRLRGNHIKVITDGLWKENGNKKLYVTKNPGLTSIFRPNTTLFDCYAAQGVSEVVETHSIRVSTLKNVFLKYDFAPTVIKLDTQGSELGILESAGDLSACEAIYVEAEFLEFYQGQPLFGDLFQYLRDNGFELKDLKRTFHRKRIKGSQLPISRSELTWCHALFLKNPKRSIDPLKNAVCNFGFGFYDFFLDYLKAELGSSAELEQELVKYSSRMAVYQRLKYLKNKFVRISHPDTDLKAKADRAFY